MPTNFESPIGDMSPMHPCSSSTPRCRRVKAQDQGQGQDQQPVLYTEMHDRCFPKRRFYLYSRHVQVGKSFTGKPHDPCPRSH
jgi:hypothetical protein